MRSPNPRPYRLGRRADHVARTRERITEATVRLHTTVGPRVASIAAIAEEAGVTRLTVYRHFSSVEDLFDACTSHWAERNPMPDPSTWAAIPDLEGRAQAGLRALYAWFRQHADELAPIYRDFDHLPARTRIAMRNELALLADTLVDLDGEPGVARPGQALARHLVAFLTWRSLTIEQGLDDTEAADLGARLLAGLGVPAPA